MEDVNHITRWAIQRPEPKGIITVRTYYADGTDHVMAVSPGRLGIDIAERYSGWYVTAVVAAPESSIFIVGSYDFGPFPRPTAADQFGRVLTVCLEDPSPSKHEAGQGVEPPAESAAERRMLTSQELDHLIADAGRYRELAKGETVDNERLVNASSYEVLISRSDKYDALQHGREVDGLILVGKNWHEDRAKPKIPDGMIMVAQSTYENLTTESQRYHQLLNGNDVDGKRLLPVDAVQRMARMEQAVKSAFSSFDDCLTDDDIDHLGFELNTD